MNHQHEVTTPQPLLDSCGLVNEPGWARKPVWEYRRSDIHAPFFRRKEWDYYLITNQSIGLAFTISDLGYAGLISVSFLDFVNRTEHTETILEPFPRNNKYGLTECAADGSAEFQNARLHLRFQSRPKKRRIQCHFKDFYNGADLKAEIVLDEPEADTMCIATPWEKKPTAFYYNQKINCMPALGKLTVNHREYFFDKAVDFGILDWGRGVWTYDNVWYWGTGSGRINGEVFGFNIGYGFSDRSSASENMLFYQGKAHKLGVVDIHIPTHDAKHYNYLAPWRITSDNQHLEGVFKPILDRSADINLRILASRQHQVFGYLNGTATLDDGTVLAIKDFLCSVEHIHNRY